MRKSIKISVLLFMFFIVFILLGNISFAKTGEINSLDYTVFIKEDGVIDVIEIIDLSLEKDIEIFSRKFEENKYITNLKVKEYNKEGEVKLEYEKVDNIDELKVNSYSFNENILNVKVDKNVRKYLFISYSVENNINYYSDCAEIDLILQESNFDYSSSEITGKVKFENTSVNLNDVYVWGHARNKVNVKRIEELNQINFILNNNDENQKFDIKVVFPNEFVKSDIEVVNDEIKLEQIIKKEKNLEQTRNFREQHEIINSQIIEMIVVVTILIFIIIICLIIIRYRIKKENINKDNIENDINQEELVKKEDNE